MFKGVGLYCDTARGSLFYHLGGRTEKSRDAGLACSLKDGGSSQAVRAVGR